MTKLALLMTALVILFAGCASYPKVEDQPKLYPLPPNMIWLTDANSTQQ